MNQLCSSRCGWRHPGGAIERARIGRITLTELTPGCSGNRQGDDDRALHASHPYSQHLSQAVPSTLRTHIRNIYLKLDVHVRLEALQKARDLRLF